MACRDPSGPAVHMHLQGCDSGTAPGRCPPAGYSQHNKEHDCMFRCCRRAGPEASPSLKQHAGCRPSACSCCCWSKNQSSTNQAHMKPSLPCMTQASAAALLPSGMLDSPAQLHWPWPVAKDLCRGRASCPSCLLPAGTRQTCWQHSCNRHQHSKLQRTLTWSSCLVCSQKRYVLPRFRGPKSA